MKKLGRNDACWCGSGKKYKACHMAMDEKIESYELQGHIVPQHDILKTPEQLQGIRESSKLNIAILDEIERQIRIGMSTEEIDKIVRDMTKEMGGIAAPLGYDGFPKSVCTSINEVVTVDVSTIYTGYCSDSSRMFMLGNVPEETRKLVRVARECIDVGLEQVKPWNFLGDMAQAINDHAKQNGYSIVREIGGHGIGLEFHEEPFVSYVTRRGTEMLMVPGMVFTIEPMVNMGKADIYIDDEDGWTVYTDDGKPSAQWEVTLAVTEDGYEILTY